jgi:adenylate kinase family enzyme
MKIVIFGSGGAGKSTLAFKLSQLTNIDVYHLDKLYWLKDWKAQDKDIFLEKLQNILLKDNYIIDGNYSNFLLKERFNDSDIVIFLDISRYVCIYSVIKRYFKYRNKVRPNVAEGCEEAIDLEFIKWIWDYPKRSKTKILDLLQTNPNKKVYILKNRSQMNKFINDFKI